MSVSKSSGNVFTDVGFDEDDAEELAVKSDLAMLVGRAIRQRRLSQREAAAICGTEQGTLSKVLSGRMRSVTIDRLARWLTALNWNITVSARPQPDGRRKARRGRMTVAPCVD